MIKVTSSLLAFGIIFGGSWSFPNISAAAPNTVVDMCSALSNPSFENGFTGWSSSAPSDDFIVPVPLNPSYTPLNTSTPVAPQSGSGFAGCIQRGYGANDSKCRLDHTVVNGNWAAGTQFRITVIGNHGRVTGANTPFWKNNKQSDLEVLFQGWANSNGAGAKANNDRYKFVQEGAWSPALGSNGLPSSDPLRGNDENNPLGFGHPVNTWVSRTITFTATAAIKSFQLSLIGKNDAHDSYVLFDVDCGGTPPPPPPPPITGSQPPREP